MIGKTCLITGSTSGIGRVTAEALAAQGARVVLIGRSQERCESAVDGIKRATKNTEISALTADLMLQSEVNRVANLLISRLDRLDVLINNAGAMFLERELTSEGLERTFALNHLSYFLLTLRLFPLIQASGDGRIISVASDAHRAVRNPSACDWKGDLTTPTLMTYPLSKLANILFTFELHRRIEGTGVTANALHPGFVRSRFLEGSGPVLWLMRQFARIGAISPEEGARTSIYLASSEEVQGVSGQYFVKERAMEPSALANDRELALRLWERSEAITGLSLMGPNRSSESS